MHEVVAEDAHRCLRSRCRRSRAGPPRAGRGRAATGRMVVVAVRSRNSGWCTASSASGCPSYATRPSRITTARSTSGASGPSSWATSTIVAPRSLSSAERVGQRLLVGQVDAGGGLVEEQQLRLAGQRAGDQHPLLLAAGQRGDAVAGPVGQADHLERVVDRGAVGARSGRSGGGGSAGRRRRPPTPRRVRRTRRSARCGTKPIRCQSRKSVEGGAEQLHRAGGERDAARSSRGPAWTCPSRWRRAGRRTRRGATCEVDAAQDRAAAERDRAVGDGQDRVGAVEVRVMGSGSPPARAARFARISDR